MREALNRREFLTYSFLVTLLFFGAMALAAMVWYALPESDYIQVGYVADFLPDRFSPGVYPISLNDINLYLVNTGTEFIVFDRHTPHQTHNPLVWVPLTGRFEDPLTASKFSPDGIQLSGPATRDLDRFPVKI